MTIERFDLSIPDITEEDELAVLVEMDDDPMLSKFWLWLRTHQPGTAKSLVEEANRFAKENDTKYDNALLIQLKLVFQLGNAAFLATQQKDTSIPDDESGDGDELVQPQAEPRGDQ